MSKNIKIREANEQDKPAILSLIRSCLPHDERFASRYYNAYFTDDSVFEDDFVLVAELNGRIIGTIGYCEDGSDYAYHISWLVVAEDYQGWQNGMVADKLLMAIENDLKRHKVRKLFVSAVDRPDRGHGFYLKHGFRFEARLRDYYGRGEDQVVFGKEL